MKVHSVAWSCDGRKLASGSYDKTVNVFHLDRDRLVRIFVSRVRCAENFIIWTGTIKTFWELRMFLRFAQELFFFFKTCNTGRILLFDTGQNESHYREVRLFCPRASALSLHRKLFWNNAIENYHEIIIMNDRIFLKGRNKFQYWQNEQLGLNLDNWLSVTFMYFLSKSGLDIAYSLLLIDCTVTIIDLQTINTALLYELAFIAMGYDGQAFSHEVKHWRSRYLDGWPRCLIPGWPCSGFIWWQQWDGKWHHHHLLTYSDRKSVPSMLQRLHSRVCLVRLVRLWGEAKRRGGEM